MKKIVCVAILAAAVAVSGRLMAEDKDKPKYKIAMIMEKAHKGGEKSLRNRVLQGKASNEELDTLVELYQELGKNVPPKGTKEAWKKKTEAVVAAVRKVKENPEDKAALATLNKATTCMACHDVFRKDEDD